MTVNLSLYARVISTFASNTKIIDRNMALQLISSESAMLNFERIIKNDKAEQYITEALRASNAGGVQD